jgi:single-stranded-DNA-specific exonuclease
MIKRLSAKIDGREMDNDELIEAILESRGIEDLSEFLHPDESALIDFDKMNGLHEAYEIIDDAITMGEKFLVLSDVDVDGVTSSAIIVRYLQACGADVVCVINEGKKHGAEDFNLDLLDNIDVMIIVDSLNNNPGVYARITYTGTKLIVLDHHIPDEDLLSCDVPFVLVSSALDYPNPALSGAGVCLKMAQYCDHMNLTNYAENLYVYAAMGIVADMCDLSVPENRYIVSRGLADFKNPIVQKMVGNYLFNSESISFSIAPLINSAMRMSENELAMNVFLTDNEDEISEFIKDLKKCRENQNAIVDSLIDDLLQQGEEQLDKKAMFFFLGDVDGDIGGLLGNRLLSQYQRPLFVIRDCGNQYCGSMRSVGLENTLELVNSTGLANCQGHESAAGFFCDKNNFEAFKEAIEEALKDVEFTTTVEADIEINAEQVNDQLIKQLTAINRVSGSGFSPITVLIRTNDYSVETFSTKKHLKIVDNNTGVLLVKWNDSAWKTMNNNKEFIGIGKLSNPYYGRNQFLQLTLDEYTQQNDLEDEI